MPSSPEMPDAETDRLVAQAFKTKSMRPADESPLLARLRTVEEYLRAVSSVPSGPALIYRDDASITKVLPIAGQAVVGRDAACELAFPDNHTLSRKHFAVCREEPFFVLRDQQSRNGTQVNGQTAPADGQVLRDGDIISAGGKLFVFSRGRDG